MHKSQRLGQDQIDQARSGQTFWRVWGNTPTDLYVDRMYVLGKRVKQPKGKGLEAYNRYIGFHCKAKVEWEKSGGWHLGHPWLSVATSVSRGLGGYVFTKQKAAERYLAELKAGLHPVIIDGFADRCYQLDLMDEALLGIDRGCGTLMKQEDDPFYEHVARDEGGTLPDEDEEHFEPEASADLIEGYNDCLGDELLLAKEEGDDSAALRAHRRLEQSNINAKYGNRSI